MLNENDVEILRYVRPSNTTLQKYADDYIAKSYNVVGTYDESTLNDVSMSSPKA